MIPSSSCKPFLIPTRLLNFALSIAADHETPIDDYARLTTIVMNAMEAQVLLFAAMRYEPSQQELDTFFEDFVVRCSVSSYSAEAR